MKKRVQRARREQNAPLPNPSNLCELQLPEEYTRTCFGRPYYLIVVLQTIAFLLFSTERNFQFLMDLMVHCAHWFADGSFKTAPPLFAFSLFPFGIVIRQLRIIYKKQTIQLKAGIVNLVNFWEHIILQFGNSLMALKKSKA